ncbi:MAG: RICIN domain-containing protein [Reichenbachiella sp.]
MIRIALLLTIVFSSSVVNAQKPNTQYRIRSAESGMFLATAGAQTKGAPVVRKSNVSYGGHWFFIKSAKGVQIYNKKHGLYMAAMGQKNQEDPVKLTNTPGTGSFWTIIPSKNKQSVQIRNNVNRLYIANMGNLPEKTPIKMTARPSTGSWWYLRNVQ